MLSILHHGAVDGVTGSCHELQIDADNAILIDCGLFQGAETSPEGATAETLAIDFPIGHIRALVVTHVHIDHVGRIPYLLAAGFNGSILCSEPSAILLPLVLEDALKIGFTRDPRLIDRFLALLQSRLVPLPYNRWHPLPLSPSAAPCAIRLKCAGHILGSAYVECRVGQGKDRQTVLFSGDLGAPWTPLLSAPRPAWGADTVVLESTYGDREHEDRRQRRRTLQAVIEHALTDRGTVLIPAFSIGRTQELLYEIEDIIHRTGKGRKEKLNWQALEIIVDSPLASRFTEAYRQLRPWWDAEAHRRIAQGRHPLSFEQLTTIDSHEDHLRAIEYLAKTARPSVVIAASGMCAGGRIVNYLKALLGDPRHDIVFVGYQAEGTPGRAIQRYGPRGGWVELDGQRYPIRAGVHTIGGYSAHADQKDLINFIRRMRHRPHQIRLIHGDKQAKQALKVQLEALGQEIKVIIP
jgi:metallo-beta-lactamase family protein